MSLNGRTFVTGAGQGIGLGVAKLAADLGANLILADTNADGLQAARIALLPARAMSRSRISSRASSSGPPPGSPVSMDW
jgi:3-oxoacyl-[acyl-carrier protein] reductase